MDKRFQIWMHFMQILLERIDTLFDRNDMLNNPNIIHVKITIGLRKHSVTLEKLDECLSF